MARHPGHNLSAAEQHYLKAIYAQTRTGSPTSTVALAAALEVRAASVTNMLQKMADEVPCLLEYRKHHGVALTAEGERAALQIIRRHRLIELFLYQALGYPLDRIHQEAENLEHAVTPYFIERIAQLLGDPPFDPHGDPIPDRRLKLRDSRRLSLLVDLQPGEAGVVRQITNQDEGMLKYLRSIGIQPGAGVRVVKVNPIDGTLQVRCPPARQGHVLGRETGGGILVERQEA